MTHEVPQPMLDPPRAAPRGIGGRGGWPTIRCDEYPPVCVAPPAECGVLRDFRPPAGPKAVKKMPGLPA